jgi:hypothetical protein
MAVRTLLLTAAALLLARHHLLSGDLDAALGAVAGAALVLLGAWLALSGLALALLRVPGVLGRVGRALVRLLLPRALRLTVLGLAGAQALTGVAWADSGGADLPSIDRPLTTAVAAVERSGPMPAGHPPRSVVVRPGESLWTIAADHLGSAATTARVAAAWPRWYAANVAVIGPDPDLVAVGTVLAVPPRATA